MINKQPHDMSSNKEILKNLFNSDPKNLLSKFEGLLDVIHQVVKKSSKERILGIKDIKSFEKAINNSQPGDYEADGGIFLERGVMLKIQEEHMDKPIEKYINKNLSGIIDPEKLLRNSAFQANEFVMETIQELNNTINGIPSTIKDTKNKSQNIIN